MMISGVSMDDKAFPMSRYSQPERPKVWRDAGMRSSPPPKMYETAGVPVVIEGLSKLNIDRKAPPAMAERKVASSRAPSVASSVTSLSSPRNMEMTDATVEAMVRTIEQQQHDALVRSKEIIAKMEELKVATKREEELRRFVEQCTAASQEMWAKNHHIQERNAKLKEKLHALRQLLQTRKSGV